ncbi:EcoKI restriction-modification system protein HsdS [Serratia marcescens]|uniref:restriction endonuclease subunit S n=1 Tax=Serratia TaxID=613 RepID=UPI0007452E2E|nr:restriction endonuclease subunit S [Serratia marcescens]MBI6197863.1 restriction endonuclease subunit S [Serratia marcescens]CVB31380.1 EcoKI restriction-modification system protein HsdS [Serratia marcescens]CVG50698.1 EcoKI restriction-modification system protein HsdS [Serratia marcescens]
MNSYDKQSVPRLRFESFRASEPWVFKPLGKLAQRSLRKNVDGKITRVLTNSAEYGVVDQREYFEKDIANQGNLEGYYVVEEGSYVYNPRISALAPVGPISKNKIGLGVMSPLYTVFKFIDSKNDFYAHYFKSTHWHQYMRQVSSTGARHDRMSISNNAFMELPLPVATSEEQQKIADCLSSLDDQLITEAKKLDTLKTYKQSLAQQLFPSEGESMPRLRFPEFQGNGEWKEKKLGSLTTKVGSGITPLGGQKNYRKSGRPFIRSQNIGWGELLLDDVAFIDEETHNSFIATQINYLDVFLNITGASIGRSAIADPRVVGGNVNQHVCIIRTTGELNPIFLNQFLISKDGQSQIDKCQAGGNRQGLNFSQIRALTIPLPTDINEQVKIANILASADALVTSQNKKIEVLKNHKKGLMQQLFPVFGGTSV